MKYSKKIREIARSYFDILDQEDFSHGFTHVERVVRMAVMIGKKEGVDLEVLEAAALLHDIGRAGEEASGIDHAEVSANLVPALLKKINFPENKIDQVQHAVRVHRSNPEFPAETLEAKILQDADRLDALGAVDIARVIASSLQAPKHRRPIYIDVPYSDEVNNKKTVSAIHYLIKKSKLPKRQPKNFNTKTGQEIAKDRFAFMLNYIDRFIQEWRGEK